MLRALVLLVLIGGAAAAGATAGYWYAGDGDSVAVTVREGAPELDEGVDAVLIVDAQLIADAVRAELEEADLLVAFEVMDVVPTAEGLRVTGHVAFGLFGAEVRADLETTAVPSGDDGGVAVDLVDTSVEGLRLPGGLETALARLISDAVASQTLVPGYSVRRIEISEDQYLVYFAENDTGPR